MMCRGRFYPCCASHHYFSIGMIQLLPNPSTSCRLCGGEQFIGEVESEQEQLLPLLSGKVVMAVTCCGYGSILKLIHM